MPCEEKQKKKRMDDLWDMQKLQKIVEWYRSRALRKQQWAEVGTALSLQAEFFCRRVDCVFRQAEKMRDSLYSTDRKRGQEEIVPFIYLYLKWKIFEDEDIWK